MQGVDWIISVSAVGSLQENIPPKDMVLIDQFIDRTKSNRACTFFEKGIVAHVAFADPICDTLRQYLLEAANRAVKSDMTEEHISVWRVRHFQQELSLICIDLGEPM